MDAARRAANPTCKAGSYDRVVQIRNGKARWTDVVEFDADKLTDPLRWRAPRRIFVNSMSDLFHDELPDEYIALVFGVMLLAAQHTYQVLTKHAARMRDWFARWSVERCLDAAARFVAPDGSRIPGPGTRNTPARKEWRAVETWPVPWIWPGVSVEDRKHGVPRIDDLRHVPAAVRMLSCEPLLEDLGTLDLTGIGWAITGCESGQLARPAEDSWFDSIEAQCRAAGVTYFLKQKMVDGKLVHDFPGQQNFPSAR